MASDGPGCEVAKTDLGCSRSNSVPAHLLMCRPHWSQVSRPAQRRVYDTLDAVGPGGQAYKLAVQDALGEVLARNQ